MRNDFRRRRILLQVFLSIHPDKLKEVRDRQGAGQQAEESEILDPGKGSDDGNEGVDLGPAAKDHGADHVVYVADHHDTPQRQTYGPVGLPFQGQV
jgi:hypothetical protein